MLYRKIGKTEERVPALGFGTWGIGGETEPDYSRDSEQIINMEIALDLGYRHIDTAEYYADGHTEELVAEAIKIFPREELFIVSKVWPNHLNKEELEKALKRSLKRLKTDYLDLYLIHWPNPDVPLKESLDTMAKLKKAEFIKHIGVSNFDGELLKEAIKVSPEPISFNQVLYNIVDKNPEKELLPLCQENDVNLTAYSPLKRGTLPSGVKIVLKEIALKYDSTIYQVMLAWLLSKERVIAIPKASSPDHLQENLNAVDLKLNPEDIERLNKLTS